MRRHDRPRRSLPDRFARGAVALLAAGLAVGSWGCGEEEPAPEEVARPVKIFEVQGAGAAATREYPGYIRAIQQADMAFEVSGKIVEFRYKEGQRVREGEVLVRLDPRDFQARLDAARSQRENARVNYERAQKLFEEGALAALERDRRKTVYDSTDAQLREAQKALDDSELKAPFDGVMARKLVEDFQNVRAKEQVLILQDDTHLEIRVNVPERDMAGGRSRDAEALDPDEITRRIEPRVIVSSLPDRTFAARVRQLAMIADPTTRTFEATFVIDNPIDASILPGMTAKVIINVPRERAEVAGVRIPVNATVADDQGNPFVWVVDASSMTVRRSPVVLGELTGAEVMVTEGLSDGTLIAVSGVNQLREGMAVLRYEQ
jgi:RND family efflux transporter MFP subunit